MADADVDPESEYRHEAAAVLVILRDDSVQEDISAHLGQAADALNARQDVRGIGEQRRRSATPIASSGNARSCRVPRAS